MTPAEKAWLVAQAGDAPTASALRAVAGAGRAGRLSCPHEPLRLDGIGVWVNPHNAYASLETYIELFRDRAHSKVGGFPPDDRAVVVDVGANEGFYTLFVKRHCPQARVIAIEPDPVAFAVLERNVLGNALEDVVLVNKAIAPQRGPVPFVSVPIAPMLSGTAMREARWMAAPGAIERIQVDALTLDDVFEEYGLDRIDLMKIDAEGAEDAILASAASLARCRRIVVEYHSRRAYDAVRRIASSGFDVVRDEREAEQSTCGDLYLLRRGSG